MLLDVASAPYGALQWLGQFCGVAVPTGAADATARTMILQESQMQRCTPSAVISAVQRHLSGSQEYVLVERVRVDGNSDGYWFIVVVSPEQVIDANQLIADVNAVKPGGLRWVLVQSDPYVWCEAQQEWLNDAMVWTATATTRP